ncbi:hypothetical protein IKG64_00600 [Candidatus Saccharibacteria bacterium]|nr:hypothetical protein [Candidatus Saccharibacteria bacterium]
MKHSTNINQIIITAFAPLAMILCSILGTTTASAASYSYSITYNDGIISNMPANTSASSYDENVPISSQTPTREGYEFLGWCNTLPTTTDGTDSCSGTTYSPGGNFTINQTTSANSLSLYTMWGRMPFCNTHTCMQDLTSSTIATLLPSTGSTATVYDSRDQQQYTIAKLADGKYWMTTNLNLAGGTTLNASDSNVPSDNYYTLPASTTISSGTSVPSDQFSSDTTAYVFNTGNNTTTCNSSTPCNSYYSWLAATAGGKDSSGNAVTNGYNAAYSICPKGWRLPNSTTSNESATINYNWKTGDWYALATAYGANLESSYYQNAATFYNNAGPGTTPNFLLAGYYYNGSFNVGGSDGYYWSSTATSSNACFMDFSSGDVSSANNRNRRAGLSVRCVYGE